MSNINCPNCGHSINFHGFQWRCETCFDEYRTVGTELCEWSPEDIAYALLTAEPTEAEVEAFKSAWESTPAGEPGARTRAGLKAAAEARR